MKKKGITTGRFAQGRQGVSVRQDRVREEFLKMLRNGFTIRAACDLVKKSRSAMYRWKREDPQFSEQWDEAEEDGTDLLEEEAIRRGRDGVPKDVYYQGDVVGVETMYSDRMLEVMLRARRPEKFNTTRTELTGARGGPVQTHELSKDEMVKKLTELGLPTRIFEE